MPAVELSRREQAGEAASEHSTTDGDAASDERVQLDAA